MSRRNGPRLRARVVVHRLGDDLLADAGLAQQQHGNVARGEAAHQGEEPEHRGIGDDHHAIAELDAQHRVRGGGHCDPTVPTLPPRAPSRSAGPRRARRSAR